jgi:hypothetical protein
MAAQLLSHLRKMTHALSNFRDIVHLLHAVVRPEALNSRDLHLLVDKIHDSLYKGDDCGCGPCGQEPIRVDAFPFSELLRPPTPPTLVIHPEQDVGEIVPNVIVTKEEPESPQIRNVVVSAPTFVHAVKLDSPAPPKPTPVLKAITPPPSDAAILHDLHCDDDDVEDDTESVINPIDEDTPTATSVADASDDETDSIASEEAEEEDEEAEEEEAEEEEDEDLELKVIKKQHYYWSPSSKRIYECLEEGYGDCLGTYDGGKIIPKA